ncbi:MAG TPA: hypothetical protein VJO34_07990, partial [Methylomirabilota bacterium]|nr:hypothetical protein [Methylomirabilota bacterium]
WPKNELAQLRDGQTGRGLFDMQITVLQGVGNFSYDCIRDSAGNFSSCQAVRYTSTIGFQERPFVQLLDARRSRPAPGGEQMVFVGPGRAGSGLDDRVLVWNPGTPSARMLFQLPPIGENEHLLGSVTGTTAMVFAPEARSFLIPLAGPQPPIFFPNDLSTSFTLLEPSHLYNTNDLKFYRLQPPLQRTPLPAKLAEVPGGNPFGDFHAVRVP